MPPDPEVEAQSGPQTMLIPKAILFLTGGVTIALEIVASRVMTPYFGGSLHVWTAILCVTLLSLAFGYGFGGRLTRAGHALLRLGFATFPALAGLALVLAVLCFPALPWIASTDIVAGAFVAATTLLAPCLVVLSALNPLVVALPGRPSGGDAGSGSVFALSTLGSVAGALVASFVLVPLLPVDHILLAMAATLGLCSVAAAVTVLGGPARLVTLAAASLTLLGSAAVPMLLPKPRSVALGDGLTAHHVASYRSGYGEVSIVELTHDRIPTRRLTAYVQNGGVQGMIHADGRIASAYARVMVEALRAYRPDARRVLVIGLAAGMIPTALLEREPTALLEREPTALLERGPTALARSGIAVDVVDIDPQSPAIAARHFGFIPARARVHILDARIFLDRCAGAGYDAVILDAFSGLDPPEHLLSVEAFGAMAACLAADGLLLANLVAPPATVPVTKAVLRTVQAALPGPMHLFSLTRTSSRQELSNRILLAGPAVRSHEPSLEIEDYPVDLFDFGARTLVGQVIAASDEADGILLSDRHNPFAVLAARAAARRAVIPLPAGW
ncbi:fused MFS/spermidine synthase [Arenibaculum pallidiluteum]|uniref:fused MFS/spermidine synthase n=1 Tax=Arenibaculum pallidiluteum TaxID=2812559 RepID=UPI001A95C47D|nr:fused MFS/spermidine synthase [Arenibaculum pallidiluteum]